MNKFFDTEESMKFVSVSDSDKYILTAIQKIYLNNNRFDLDPTYSKGVFYKKFGIEEPHFKSDINPQYKDVIKADSRNLCFKSNELHSIIFDPPFLFRDRISKNTDLMCTRFSYFNTYDELINMYSESLLEFYRILKNKGFVIFKCQDMTDGSGSRPFYDTHVDIIKIARNIGFSLRDIVILTKFNKIIKNSKKQGCFRKIHSYYLIFRKEKKVNFGEM